MELSITEIKNKYKVIKPIGRIDWESARLLDKEINQIIEDGFYHIVFNLDEVNFICSGGIGALVYNLNKVRKKNGAIYIISSNHYINYIFETLKFDIVFEGYLYKTFEDFASAVLEKEHCETTS
ncbi:MAG: STAS domain-containing protein [Chitinispirillaceae bacterium]|nr:STAS domain-containing protein [Chitinispirillaceae bacterium]